MARSHPPPEKRRGGPAASSSELILKHKRPNNSIAPAALQVEQGVGMGDLVCQINKEHESAVSSFNAGLEHALACGRLLIEARKSKSIPHGAWLPWLELNCFVSARMAQIYMRLARQEPRLPSNAKRVADFNLRQAIASISQPRLALKRAVNAKRAVKDDRAQRPLPKWPVAEEYEEAGIEDDIEDPENYRTAYLLRVDQATRFASYSGPVTTELITAARQVARTWTKLADAMEAGGCDDGVAS